MAKKKKPAARREVEQFRLNLKAAIDADGRSVYQLARASGMSHTTIIRALRPNQRGMLVQSIVLLCDVLQVSPSSLFVGVGRE